MPPMRVSWIACALVLGGALGCNDDLGSTRDGSVPIEPAEKKISAEDGGKVKVTGAEVAIPSGALAEDTEITIEELDREGLPDLENVASKVFDFGPDGTTFEQPVTLTIDFDAARTPKKMRAVMAFLDADEWRPLADSEVEGNSVVATTTHFTAFAIIFVPADQLAQSCDDIDFEPCGGDLIGTWRFTLGCVTFGDETAQAALGPFATCDGAEIAVSTSLEGTITFGEDGAFEIKQTIDTTITETIPTDCFMEDETCESAGAGKDEAVEVDDRCEISETSPNEYYDLGTYTVEENTFTTTSEGVSEPSPQQEYCVNGNTLTLRASTEGVQTTVYQAVKE